ncbi:LysR family transcriptional regulator [Celeribacter sp.]|uniref:LysR family transcriptional regulator n=1 Tax=Celeribacter sp. TaxID=1890673 RepID=UPI003A9515F6
MSPTLKQLEILKAVVTTGSISKAARLLGFSQPTLSQQIAKMEKTLGEQLFTRGRSSSFLLTGPGEYWYQVAVDMLDRHATAEAFHNAHFKKDRIELQFSSPYAFRFWFFGKSAELAVSDPRIGGLEYIGSRSSTDVLEMLALRKINCGVVNEAFITKKYSDLHVTRVCRDQTVLVVPETIPDEVVQEAIETREAPEDPAYVALTRYVDLGDIAPWRDHTQAWFRTNLPFAFPFFRCSENVGAAWLVAEGVATAHVPLSMVRRLPDELRNRVRIYEIDGSRFNISFVAPKHYQSTPAFVAFQQQLCAHVSDEFECEMRMFESSLTLTKMSAARPVNQSVFLAAE